MNPIAKLLISCGILLVIVGIIWQFGTQLGGKFLLLGRLPGDIAIEKGNFRFYFPIATSILVSIVLSLILYIIRYFSNRN